MIRVKDFSIKLRRFFHNSLKLFFFPLLIISCSSNSPTSERALLPKVKPNTQVSEVKALSIRGVPWVSWRSGHDYRGNPLTDPNLLTGDKLFADKRYDQAKIFYQAALTESPNALHDRIGIFRLASTLLTLGEYSEAKKVLSNYFSKSKVKGEHLISSEALLLGYVYGSVGEFDQSIAWLQRVTRSKASRGITQQAKDGLRQLVASIPIDKFESTAVKWRELPVQEYFAAERRTRSLPGFKLTESAFIPQFLPSQSNDVAVTERRKILALLPLSGKFGTLGNASKRGLLLAESNDELKLPLEIVDTEGSVEQAVSKLQSKIESNEIGVIIGPLLSEVAVPVSAVASKANVPIISFSKKEPFATGESVFRLGVTASGQVNSLLEKSVGRFNLQRIGVVYEESATGLEYLQAIERKVLSLGITLHFQSSYKVGDLLGLTTLATTLAKKEVDAIIFPGKIGDAITFFGSLQGAGVTKSPRPLGFAHWEDERSLKNSPLPLAGGIFTSPFSKFSNQDFINAYTVKFGKAPDFLAAQSFDALMLTLSSMKLVLDKDEPSFGAALRSITEYRGVTGVLRPQSNGEIERSYKLLTINEGRLSEIPE